MTLLFASQKGKAYLKEQKLAKKIVTKKAKVEETQRERIE
jgi:hypothetical protein